MGSVEETCSSSRQTYWGALDILSLKIKEKKNETVKNDETNLEKRNESKHYRRKEEEQEEQKRMKKKKIKEEEGKLDLFWETFKT